MIKQLINEEKIDPEEGVDNAFSLIYTINETVKILKQVSSGLWVNNVFFFVNPSGKILYTLNNRAFTYGFTDKKKYLIGYL